MTEPEARSKLPGFKNPPVIEVALSVVFEPLAGYTSAHSGLFWSRVSDRFTRAKDQPPLAIPAEEEFPTPQEPTIKVLGGPPPSRVWLLNDDETELIQLQQDTFSQNWRQQQSGKPYPRYEYVRGRFDKEFREFVAFSERERLGSPRPLHCEVTYVNHIMAGQGWSDFGELHKILSVLSPERTAFLPFPDEVHFTTKVAIRDSTGQFIGRLTVSAKPAFRRKDKERLIALTLTARGSPVGLGVDGVLAFFDIGHEWIVQGFADVTTEEMHRFWERTQ